MTSELEPSAEISQDEAPQRGVTWKRGASAAFSLIVIIGIFYFVMPLIADYDGVFATIGEMTTLELVSLVLIGLWNLATYWFMLVAALPGLRLREAAVVNQASTAVSNTLPAGGALGVGISVAMLTSWGFTIAAITRSAIVTGIWNNFVKLGMPVLAIALLALEGGITPARVTAAAIGIAVLVAAIVVFRAITYLLPIPLGIASYIIWRVNKSWRLSQEERRGLAGDAYDAAAEPAT